MISLLFDLNFYAESMGKGLLILIAIIIFGFVIQQMYDEITNGNTYTITIIVLMIIFLVTIFVLFSDKKEDLHHVKRTVKKTKKNRKAEHENKTYVTNDLFPTPKMQYLVFGTNKNPDMQYAKNNNKTKIEIMFSNEWSEQWFKWILNNLDKPWDWNGISCNPNLTMKMIMDNPEKPWNWSKVSVNPNIAINMIADNFENPLNLCELNCNQCVTMEMIMNDSNITMQMIVDNPEKPWNWFKLSYNSFENEKENYILSKMNWLLLALLFEKYSNFDSYDANHPYSRFELILSDSYLVKNIMKF